MKKGQLLKVLFVAGYLFASYFPLNSFPFPIPHFDLIGQAEAIVSDGPNYDFTKTWGDGDNMKIWDVVATPNEIYVGGYFQNTIDFDPGAGTDNHTSNGDYDAFLSNFDGDGNHDWTCTWGSTGTDSVEALDVDASQRVYAVGYYSGTVDFDCTFGEGEGIDNHTSRGLRDFAVTSYDADGNYRWTQAWGSAGADDHGMAVAVSKQIGATDLYIGGEFGCETAGGPCTFDFNWDAGTCNKHSYQ